MPASNVLSMSVNADTIEDARTGSCVVILQNPFAHEGKRYSKVRIGPFKFKHFLSTKEGKYKDWTELMMEVVTDERGESMQAVLGEVSYPDTDRIELKFMEMMPEQIRVELAQERFEPPPLPAAERGFVSAVIDAEKDKPEDVDFLVDKLEQVSTPATDQSPLQQQVLADYMTSENVGPQEDPADFDN